MPKPLRIFFSAGEPSGDLHAANLIRQLRAGLAKPQAAGVPDTLEAVGYGGPQMAAAGCTLHADLTRLAVMWFARALANLHKFWDLASRADRYFRHHRPDAVVLVDYPGFNWWIARRAKVHGIPVFYYTPPQIWAWATWRVRKMRRLADHVLCSLPFEAPWFRAHGCNATFVGHPFFDEVRRQPLDEEFMARVQGDRSRGETGHFVVPASAGCGGLIHAEPAEAGTTKPAEAGTTKRGPLVTILPGSRTQEVASNLRWFLKAAARIQAAVPGVRFAVAAFREKQAEMARKTIANWKSEIGNCKVYVGRTPELMHLADCCMACSGSVSLELLHHAKPTVILYWISRPAYFVQGFFRRVRYITLVNLLANEGVYPWVAQSGDRATTGDCKLQIANCKLQIEDGSPEPERALFPEYLTCGDRSAEIAGHVIQWLTDPAARAARVAELERLRDRVGQGGASERAAEYILRVLEKEGRQQDSRG